MVAIAAIFTGYNPLEWIGLVCTLTAVLAGAFCKKRTAQGQGWLNSLVEMKRKFQQEGKEHTYDPNLFYHLLPYTYAMKWGAGMAATFRNDNMPPPHWLEEENVTGFNSLWLHTYIDINVQSIDHAMTSSADSSTSGSSASSGGGFGGGGGGSW